ncbi:hypothetical protein B0T13DRAFT_145945 [Neurospora crassa]|nr:hypothetical protein B0T13DRAFT_145945 [Neurospora crassa]
MQKRRQELSPLPLTRILPPSHHLSSPHRLEPLNPENESTWLEEAAEYGMVTRSSRTIAEIDSVSAGWLHNPIAL